MCRRARASGKATTFYFAGFKQCLIIVVAKLYYVRGFALANITFITGNTGWHGFDNLSIQHLTNPKENTICHFWPNRVLRSRRCLF